VKVEKGGEKEDGNRAKGQEVTTTTGKNETETPGEISKAWVPGWNGGRRGKHRSRQKKERGKEVLNVTCQERFVLQKKKTRRRAGEEKKSRKLGKG